MTLPIAQNIKIANDTQKYAFQFKRKLYAQVAAAF